MEGLTPSMAQLVSCNQDIRINRRDRNSDKKRNLYLGHTLFIPENEMEIRVKLKNCRVRH